MTVETLDRTMRLREIIRLLPVKAALGDQGYDEVRALTDEARTLLDSIASGSSPDLVFTIDDSQWQPIGPDDANEPAEAREKLLWSRILYTPAVTINGVGFHLEGWLVEYDEDEHRQVAFYQDEDLGLLHQAVGADGSWDTVTINGREYVLAMSPYC